MDTCGTRTCRGLQPDDARVGANARDAAKIGASLGRLLNHKDPTETKLRAASTHRRGRRHRTAASQCIVSGPPSSSSSD